jgi:hypothetical protein
LPVTEHEPITYIYVSPDGTVSSNITDMYDCTYTTYREWIDDRAIVKLTKRSSAGEIIYTNQIQNDPGCEGIPDYFIMWSGNYFTWTGSEDGMKLTKYTMQQE